MCQISAAFFAYLVTMGPASPSQPAEPAVPKWPPGRTRSPAAAEPAA